MSKTYGYCRISTPTQNIERQERNIKAAYPNAFIVKEVFTGTKVEGRNEFKKLLRIIKPGDSIVFDSVSRMSRNSAEGVELYQQLFNDGMNLIFLKEPHINTSVYKDALERQIKLKVDTGDNATDKFINTIIEALKSFQIDLASRQIVLAFDQAQKEVDDLRQRTKEGIETAKLNGKRVGTEKGRKLVVKKSIESKKEIIRLSKSFEGSNKDKEVIAILNIDPKTFYKYKKEIKEEQS